MAFYSASPFAGPEVGPMFSGFANYFTGSFRWSFWTITIWSAITWLLIFLFVPETFHPMILTKRARKIRKETGDESYKSQHEINYADKTIRQTLWLSSLRVPQLLALEPMLFLLCLWSALLLGIIYLLFEAYPIVFEQGHGFNLWQTGLVSSQSLLTEYQR
jgi:Major Facilitator Superfamily